MLPGECIAIEDSRVGVQAAVAAGAHCIAVPTAYTSREVHASGLLEERWIVDRHETLPGVVATMLAEQGVAV